MDCEGRIWTRDRRHALIPGGAHTFSRGDDQFPDNAPSILTRGSGAYVWDDSKIRYIDWVMGLKSVSIGHADERIDLAAFQSARDGVNLSRPSPLEFEVASQLRQMIPSAEMVKFGKNGSDATAAAVRLARAFTGRDVILRCANDPFHSVHDWFIGSTVMSAGVTEETKSNTSKFNYNDIVSLELVYERFSGNVAAVILEPMNFAFPDPGFLEDIRSFCNDKGVVMIFDETLTGFRFAPGGAQSYFGVTPDLSTFGKALANGYPLSALVGRSEIMSLGGLDHQHDRVFLMSSTYGPERVSLAAAYATIERLADGDVIDENWRIGFQLTKFISSIAEDVGLSRRLLVVGADVSPFIFFTDGQGKDDFALKTLFLQEMASRRILMTAAPCISASHRGVVVDDTMTALRESICALGTAVESGTVSSCLTGLAVKPVFRRRNEQ